MGEHELAARLRGTVIGPGQEGYDERRLVWNARFDRRPDLIARCVCAEDVAAAVRWAREKDVRISVKGGGHSYAGHTVMDGGLLLDMSGMSAVKVQPESGLVTVEAGASWAALDSATQHHGLATTGVTVSSVGVAGSVLGGGSGWLSRRFGHALDNLTAVELVTAAGERVRASESEHPELFWGMRGAGPNFGVATSLQLRVHPVGPTVLAGQIVYPFDDADRMLSVFRDVMAGAPDDFQCLPFTFRAPPVDVFPAALHGQPVLDFVVFHRDPAALDVVQPLRQLGGAVLDTVAPTAYTAAQQAFDPNLPGGQRYYSTAHDLAGLTDSVIADLVANVRLMKGPLTAAYLEPRGGAVARVPAGATAAGGREAPYAFHVLAGWTDAGDDDAVMTWARSFSEAMATHGTGGVYVNLIADDEAERVPQAFSDHARLRELKRRWDPDNTFRNNHNVLPA